MSDIGGIFASILTPNYVPTSDARIEVITLIN